MADDEMGSCICGTASEFRGEHKSWLCSEMDKPAFLNCPNGADSGMDLMVGFRLGMEMASGSSSRNINTNHT